LSPGRVERHGFEYDRHGTLSLFAALNTQTGAVVGETVPRHTNAAFATFLETLRAAKPVSREVHVILDNLSTHKTPTVRALLVAHPQVHLHFTPCMRRDSIKSSSGSDGSNGTCSPAASSRPSLGLKVPANHDGHLPTFRRCARSL
jgi:hypothetical protein